MDLGSLADQVQDAGLAQTIQSGLQKAMMKPAAFPDAGGLEAKKGGLTASVLKTTLGKHCVDHWAKATGDSPENWENFKESAQFTVLAKYLCFKDNVKKEKVLPGQFQEQRPLGRGAFGAVFLVFKKDTGAPMATKKMMKTIVKDKNMIKDALIEREVLEKVKSPFLVNLLYAWQDDTWIGLVLTLCPGGDLMFQIGQQYPTKDEKGKKVPDKSKTYPGFNPKVLKMYIASMAIGISHIHEAGYVYRDLKPHNVLLDLPGQVRISDMGLTADISKGAIKQCSGTRGYWSPETINKEPYTTAPDWFSLGVTAYVLNTDKLCFHGKDAESQDAMTCNDEIDFKLGGDREPEQLQKLINALCTKKAENRLACGPSGVAELKGHEYFSGFDWAALESGKMPAELVPDPNDINAPSASEVAGFEAPKGVTWDQPEKDRMASWDFMSEEYWEEEAIFLMDKRKELDGGGGGGGGGGCCTIA